MFVFWGASHTHSSQHFPGTLTRRGMGQSGLGRRMSMLHRGIQPTAPSRHVHWYLQLLWKDSPLLYTIPPITQVAPPLAVGGGEENVTSPVTQTPAEENNQRVSVLERQKKPVESHITCADSYAAVDGGAEVTEEPFVGVAHVPVCAKLAHLLGTHPAAAAGIGHQAHTRGTLGVHIRTTTLPTALLSHSLRDKETGVWLDPDHMGTTTTNVTVHQPQELGHHTAFCNCVNKIY